MPHPVEPGWDGTGPEVSLDVFDAIKEDDVHLRIATVALGALTSLAIPSVAQAQKPVPVAPAQLLAQREELRLTPGQVRELSLLSAQVRRFQQALLLAPSKPWIASTRGTGHDEASERALALLSPQQRDLALRTDIAGAQELAADSDPPALERALRE